jgi:hypothetical protein
VLDLSLFGGQSVVNNTYIDTQTYYYDVTAAKDRNSDFNDISGGWGMEKAKNFERFDDDSGYNYMSYMDTIDISDNSINSIQIRGFVPTVSFVGTVRIVGKNWTDFGKISFNNLITEIADLSNNNVYILPDGRLHNDTYRIAKRYTSNYTRALLHFNDNFKGTFTLGRGFTNPDFAGLTVTTNGFGEYISKYIFYNTFIQQQVSGITQAQSGALAAVRAFISANYTGILPPIVLQRNRYTDPLTFSIKFQSALIPPYTTKYDQWGLGWNLGFAKIDTPYSTRHVANTFIRIVDDYIYLNLNEEFDINTIDITQKENLAVSRDTMGQTKRYYGKLLLNSFGSFSQTFVQSPKPFSAPLGKLDRLTLTWVDANDNPIFNDDCEFNMVIEVSEMVDIVDSKTTVVMGT